MSIGAALADLDRRISEAAYHRDKTAARWARCPSTENALATDEAQDELDRLLDERFKVQQ